MKIIEFNKKELGVIITGDKIGITDESNEPCFILHRDDNETALRCSNSNEVGLLLRVVRVTVKHGIIKGELWK